VNKSTAHPAHPSTRKARTNRGKFGSLERRYWQGVLTPEEEERFEAIVYATHSLYKAARQEW
jgi:hypothetical protein